jgi:hypothetical protein
VFFNEYLPNFCSSTQKTGHARPSVSTYIKEDSKELDVRARSALDSLITIYGGWAVLS